MKSFLRSQTWKDIPLLTVLAVCGWASPLFAQSGPGTSGAVELKIPVNPRVIAMGQAFAAVADDASAVYWNPAGLRQLGGVNVMAQYDVFIETVRYDYFAAATKLGNEAAIGLGVKYLTTGTEPAIDASGVTTGGTVGETYLDVELAGAYKINYYLDIGLTGMFISKTLASTSAVDFAGNIGLFYKTPLPHMTAGLVLQNLGPGMKFDQITDPLPLNVKVGVAYRMFEDNFVVDLDMNIPTDNAVSANLGGEYWYRDVLVGRFGYMFQGSIDQNQVGVGAVSGLYLGAGVKVEAFRGVRVGLDYAWTNDGFLGSNHHFGLDAYF